MPAVCAASTQAPRGVLGEVARFLRHSRSLAAMLPWLLLTAVITAVITAAMQWTWFGYGEHFVGNWVEAWLATWAIAFPIAFVLGPLPLKCAVRAPVPKKKFTAGLSFDDIADASARVTRKHGLIVRRDLKDSFTIG